MWYKRYTMKSLPEIKEYILGKADTFSSSFNEKGEYKVDIVIQGKKFSSTSNDENTAINMAVANAWINLHHDR